MVKYLIAVLFFVSVAVRAQEPITFSTADSITYQCYLTGDWEKLIKTGKEAIDQNIDYKRLRQRMGYAYFARADYYASQLQYEKALTFDAFDPDTRLYLYYCGINTGNEAYARYHAEKLTNELRQKINEQAVKPVDAIDLEYNFKANNVRTRSNPSYYRAGVNSQLGYRLTLYQSVSNYQQIIANQQTRQPEYFALLDWSITSHLSLDVAYHYLNLGVDGYKYPGNMVFAALSTSINRFTLGINGSVLKINSGNFQQFGFHAGVTLPGKSSIYLKSSVNGLIGQGEKRLIYNQVAGLRLVNKLWAEGNVTCGNIKNYNDHNSLYIYNSFDPTTFRTGVTLFWSPGKIITLFGNYSYELKQIELNNNTYQQHSFSGGIIWKF